MNAPPKPQPRALHFPDGQLPTAGNLSLPDPSVERLVIGSWKTKQGGGGYELVEIAAGWLTLDWKVTFPKLKAVHLWNLQGLTQLPALPANLHTLEVRNCEDLTALPVLPETLEVLDVSGCGGLAKLTPKSTTEVPNLKQVFFEDCPGLSHDRIVSFTTRLLENKASALLELRVTNHANLADSFVAQLIDDDRQVSVAKTLIKVVLRGCKNLTTVGNLEPFAKLRHLDLSNCPKLSRIVDLPNDLQYLAVWGPESIRFLEPEQEIPKFDLGTKEQPNVAGRFRTRKKFGGELTLGAHAKILFLGDGRAGKSNLANSIRQHFSRRGSQPVLIPSHSIASTDGLQLGRWETHVVVPENQREKLRHNSTPSEWKKKWQNPERGELNADLQLWDFGGQEIYHQTHRAFAGVGTVYVLVYRPETMTEQELIEDYRKQRPLKVELHGTWCDQEEWLEQNRQHPLDYWIKYLESLGTPGRPLDLERDVLLVCSQPPTAASSGGSQVPMSPDPARRTMDPALLAKIPKNNRFVFDSRKPVGGPGCEYHLFVETLRKRCGEIASELSLVQPRVYETVVNYVESTVEQNQIARQPSKTPRGKVKGEDCLRRWSKWCDDLRVLLGNQIQPALTEDDLESLTAYLDTSGRVLTLRERLQLLCPGKEPIADPCERHVVLDVSWVLEQIYRLLARSKDANDLFQTIRQNNGLVKLSELMENPFFRGLDATIGCQPMLQFMEQCGILVPLSSTRNETDQLFVATEKALLPPWVLVDEQCGTQVNQLKQSPGIVGRSLSFVSPQLCEFDMRPILAQLGRALPGDITFFQDGMQSCGTGTQLRELGRWHEKDRRNPTDLDNNLEATRWLVRLFGEPREPESLLVQLRGALLVQGPASKVVEEHIVDQLRDLPAVARVNVESAEVGSLFTDLSPSRSMTRLEPQQFEYDLFISYSTADDRGGWVLEFLEKLRKSRFCPKVAGKPIRIWWDKTNIEEDAPLSEQIRSKVQKSRLLMVFLSTNYISSKWCRDERLAFCERFPDAVREKRIQLIDLGDLGLSKRPSEFSNLRGYHFFVPEAPDAEVGELMGYPLPNIKDAEHKNFFRTIDELARTLQIRLAQ